MIGVAWSLSIQVSGAAGRRPQPTKVLRWLETVPEQWIRNKGSIMTKRDWLYGTIVTAFICLTAFVIWQVGIKPIVFTRQYGAEMHDILVVYEKTVGSIASHQNPDILAAVAHGDVLEYLQKYRCLECPTVSVVVNVNIENLKVLEYSDDYVEVFARTEIGAVSVHPVTLEIKRPCSAIAIEGVDIMIWEDGHWKISGSKYGRADTWTPVEELREKVCPENYDLKP